MNRQTPLFRGLNGPGEIRSLLKKSRIPLLLALGTAGLHAQQLAHRWSFTDLNDSVGGANVTLVGTATNTGGQLQLPGGTARTNYATVAIGATLASTDSLTVETWFTNTENVNWAKIWMFGAANPAGGDPLSFVDFTPASGIGGTPPSSGFRAGGGTAYDTRGGTNPPTPAVGAEVCATVVYDDPADEVRLYLNGVLADSAAWPGKISQLGNTTSNFIGAAVGFNDSCIHGTVNELRVWKGVLPAGQISANYAAGTETVPARNPHISAPATVSTTSNGSPVTISIPITNPGATSNLSVTSATTGGTDAALFSVSSPLPLTVAPNGSTNLQVLFTQGTGGTYSGTITLGSNDPFEPTKVVSITVEVAQPDISVPASYSFGPVANTAGAQVYNVVINNVGQGPLYINTAVMLAGPAPTHFQQFEIAYDFLNLGELTIPAGSSGNLPVRFTPTGLKGGIKSGMLKLLSDDIDENDVNVRLDVEVTAPAGGESTPVIKHRWSFNDNVDSVGDADVILNGTSSITGGNLVLPGGGTRTNHATVPVGLTMAKSSSLTVETWFTPAATADWAKVWMFGTAGPSAAQSTYIDFTQKAGLAGNPPTASFATPAGETNTRTDPVPATLAVGTTYHAIVVYDSVGDQIRIYLDGVLIDTAPWTGEIFQLGNTVDNFIGAAVFYPDGDWVGSISEMRIWTGAFTDANASASQAAGTGSLPDVTGGGTGTPPIARIGTIQITGGNIVLSNVTGLIPGTSYFLQTSTDLVVWTPVAGSTFTGGATIPNVPVSGPKRFVRIVLGTTP